MNVHVATRTSFSDYGAAKKKSANGPVVAKASCQRRRGGSLYQGENSLRRMTIGNDFIGDRRFWLVITISNAHLCPPGAERSLSTRATPRSVAPGGPFGVPADERAGQVWALLFSLPVSISHLLARPTLALPSLSFSFSLPPLTPRSFRSGEIAARPRPCLFSF